MGHLILEVLVKVQCTFNTVAVLRHTVPPLKEIANYGGITATTGLFLKDELWPLACNMILISHWKRFSGNGA